MKVVINGCFDIFHEGHEHLIQQAILYATNIDCSKGSLLVLINSDDSVLHLKGRIKDPSFIRKKNIEDFLVRYYYKKLLKYEIDFFDNELALASKIDNYKPNIIIKGNDRTDVSKIVGYPNWPIMILPRIPGFSTTKLYEELNGK